MNAYGSIYSKRRTISYPQAAYLDPYNLSKQFNLKVGYIYELLVDLHRESVISIAKWDGSRERPLDEWLSVQAFLDHTADAGYIRTRLRRRGKQLFEQLKTTAISA